MYNSKQCLKLLHVHSKQNCSLSSKRYDVFEQHFIYKMWSSESESTLDNSKNPILKEIRMLTFSTSTKIKYPHLQKIVNILKFSKDIQHVNGSFVYFTGMKVQ